MNRKCIKFNGQVFDLSDLSRAELLFLKVEIDDEVIHIKSQIKEAKNKVIQHGTYSDPDWYRRATDAARIISRNSQMVQAALTSMNQAEKENRLKSLPLAFMDAAYELLDKEVYVQINALANEIMRIREAKHER